MRFLPNVGAGECVVKRGGRENDGPLIQRSSLRLADICDEVREDAADNKSMATMGLEPIRPEGQGILSPQRLPFRHVAKG